MSNDDGHPFSNEINSSHILMQPIKEVGKFRKKPTNKTRSKHF